jgi:multifunctional 2-oxoglutarate metabolism enzyme
VARWWGWRALDFLTVTAPISDETLLGPNSWLVDDMRADWDIDPTSVPESWQAYFAAGHGANPLTTAAFGAADSSVTTSPATNGVPSPAAATSGEVQGAPTISASIPSSAPVASAAAVSSAVGAPSSAAPASSNPTVAAPSAVADAPSAPATAPATQTASTTQTAPTVATAATIPTVQASAPATHVASVTTVTPAAPATANPTAPVTPTGAGAAILGAAVPEPLRGVSAKIVSNMEASLTVPTATSVRDVPAKLLEVERNIINRFLARSRGGKVSFTHIIAYAIVRALNTVPAMKNTYVEVDGKPMIVRNPHVGLGIAVDVKKSDGSRSLVVPCIKNADTLSFREFYDAYEALIAKARINKLGVEDFAGTTVSITNPGGLGTRHSIPRLMPSQAAIIGLGTIDYPAAFSSADPAKLAEIGISKVVTVTSTYDHRVIQGAESGSFLNQVQANLEGKDDFYDDIFTSMGVPYEPARWNRDSNANVGERSIAEKAAAIQEIINAYRSRGHLITDLDPLDAKAPTMPAELDPITWDMSIWDLDRTFYTGKIAGKTEHTLGDLLGILRDAYCRTTGVEYMHIMNPVEKRWIQERVEGVDATPTPDEQRHILGRLNAAEAFEKFLHKRYTGQKRFGLEGGESAMVILDAILDTAAQTGVTEAVIGMPHRGRLNTLVNLVGKSVGQLFREFEDMPSSSVQGSGDVKYHLGATGTYAGFSGAPIELSLAPNPSHLETVAPVVEGIVRAKLDATGVHGATSVLPLIMHGDSAFAGQGVVPETLNLSQLTGYKTGGTVHLVINNQVGFTTNPDSARSTVYCTDVAKMIQAPIFHVNGDDPEACYRVGRLAMEFRNEFKKDVVIDMVCYRKHGHNEGDEPRYTQPLMYERIDARPSVREIYTSNLVGRKIFTQEDAEQAIADFEARMQVSLDETRAEKNKGNLEHPIVPHGEGLPSSFVAVPTGVARETLDHIAAATHSWPADFTPHPKLAKQMDARAATYLASGEIDWALGEAMAYGSLALEGHPVRISGQDSRRGTFSHRQAVMIDVNNGAEYYPLANLSPDQARFTVYDSSLSEYAVLGFEYGYSQEMPNAFVAWEAQFGDFGNGAQIMIDQYLVSGEAKWQQTTSLAMLLPHGYEGQGPEHSSARLERFLQLCADDNIRVANVTTAAQIFHLLRRQIHSANAKPLVLMSPKSGLRAKQTRSNVSELTTGSFQEVLDDATYQDKASAQRVILCSGKVAWDAYAARDAQPAAVAVVRVEQLYPWPEARIREVLAGYPNATEIVWMQEEPANMGGWSFVQPRLAMIAATMGRSLAVISRPASASPAVGSHHAHDEELEALKHAVTAF